MDLSERIKEKRRAIGLSQQVLALRVGVSMMTVRRWESGERAPDANALQRLSAELNVTTSYLLGETDDPAPIPNLEALNNDPQIEILKEIARDPRKFAAAALLNDMDENQLRKAFEYLSDQKQLVEYQRLKEAQ
jgi:transcriptional regulator with XRE-family HTH domain